MRFTTCLAVPAVFFCFAAASSAQEAIQGESAFDASKFVGTVEDLDAFSKEVMALQWDVANAVEVKGLVLERDAAKITLDGTLFLAKPARGLIASVMFFGKGRFQLRPPIAVERQQVRRFLGTDEVDVVFDEAEIEPTGRRDQELFRELMARAAPAPAQAAREASKEAKKWMEEEERWAKGNVAEEDLRGRRFGLHRIALGLYQQFLYPDQERALFVDMGMPDVEAGGKSAVGLDSLGFSYSPFREEEVQLFGVWDHGVGKAGALITSFHASDQYDGTLDDAGTSRVIEAEDKRDLAVQAYKLDLILDPGEPRDVREVAQLDLEVLRPQLKHLLLTVNPRLKVTRAWLDGAETKVVQPPIPDTKPQLHAREIFVFLPRPVGTGEKLQLKLELEGRILANYDGYTWYVLDEDVWFPTPAVEGVLLAKFDTTLVVPKGYLAVANGAETPCESRTLEPGQQCMRFVTSRPIRWATFNVGRSMKIDRGTALDGTPVAVYTNTVSKVPFTWYTEAGSKVEREYNLTTAGPGLVETTRAALAIYEDWFGDFPYERLALTPHPKGHGRGFASLLLLDQQAFLTDSAWGEIKALTGSAPDPWTFDAFVTHEIAHQWWGGAVGFKTDRDQWFSEGFANYASVLCLERFDSVDKTDFMKRELEDWLEHLTKEEGHVNTIAPLALGNRIDSAQNRRGFQGVRSWYIYEKGGFVLHMLRTMARALKGDVEQGDALFKKAMHDFIGAHYLGSPTNLDMQKSISKTYGVDLSWFFAQWVHGLGMPKLDFSYTVEPQAGGQQLQARVRQSDTDFKFPLTVVLHFGKGKDARTAHFYQWVTSKDFTFKVPVPERPDKVTINDDLGLLCTWKDTPWTAASGQ